MINPAELLFIDSVHQQLHYYRNFHCIYSCPVSTAKQGMGEKNGSGCTPRGWHIVREKIGETCVANTVFTGRQPTGEILSDSLLKEYPERDWILTRILWLGGLEHGKNRLGSQDTFFRYIYLHACPDNYPLGTPLSHGCIRLHNNDMLRVFALSKRGLRVFIGPRTLSQVLC